MGWMEEAERAALRRMLPLLLSFASLAERAAGLPFLLRLPVLLILARAEAVARSYLLGRSWDLPASTLAEGRGANRAMHLAARFRALAALLAVFFAQESARSWACGTAPRAIRAITPRRPAASQRRPAVTDTS